MEPVVEKLANISSMEKASGADTADAASFMVGTIEMSVPLAGLVNVDEELEKAEAELKHQREFLETTRKKLSNENFTAHAPEKVVALERKKEQDSLSKIATLEAQIKALKENK
jgi:valyl-tRNA synthetase